MLKFILAIGRKYEKNTFALFLVAVSLSMLFCIPVAASTSHHTPSQIVESACSFAWASKSSKKERTRIHFQVYCLNNFIHGMWMFLLCSTGKNCWNEQIQILQPVLDIFSISTNTLLRLLSSQFLLHLQFLTKGLYTNIVNKDDCQYSWKKFTWQLLLIYWVFKSVHGHFLQHLQSNCRAHEGIYLLFKAAITASFYLNKGHKIQETSRDCLFLNKNPDYCRVNLSTLTLGLKQTKPKE